ncbi:hypothetical protein ACFLZP_04995 [Patescibacteria group bacterium]
MALAERNIPGKYCSPDGNSPVVGSRPIADPHFVETTPPGFQEAPATTPFPSPETSVVGTETPENFIKIEGIGSLAQCLKSWVATKSDLYLDGADQPVPWKRMEGWLGYLQRKDHSPQARFKKIADDLPGATTDREVAGRWLGSRLSNGNPPITTRKKAHSMGRKAVLALEAPLQGKGFPLSIPTGILPLTYDTLETAAILSVEATEPGSVANRLLETNWANLYQAGLWIEIRRGNHQSGAELPASLLQIIKSLRHQQSAQVLENYIMEQSTSSPEACVSLLEQLTSLLMFLDSQNLLGIWAEEATGESKSNTASIPILPFKTLEVALVQNINKLEGKKGYENYRERLTDVLGALRERFAFVMNSPLGSGFSIPLKGLVPSETTLARKLYDWGRDQTPQDRAALGRIAFTGLRLYQLSVAVNLEEYCHQVSLKEPIIGSALRLLAAKLGFLADPNLHQKIREETLRQLKERPWQDLARYSPEKFVTSQTRFVDFYLGPGTYAVFHPGHMSNMQRLQGNFHFLDNLDPERAKQTTRIIVFLPIPDVRRAIGYKKPWDQVGWAYDRVGGMGIALAEESRSLVTITIDLQNQWATDGYNNLIYTMNSLKDWLKSSPLTTHLAETTNFHLFYGSDELSWLDEPTAGNFLAPKKRQKPKLQIPSVCLSRYGDFLKSIEAIGEIVDKTDIRHLVLSPDRDYGSTTTIQDIQTGDTSKIPPAISPWALDRWNHQACARRRLHPRPENYVVPPVEVLLYDGLKNLPGIGNIPGAVPHYEELVYRRRSF